MCVKIKDSFFKESQMCSFKEWKINEACFWKMISESGKRIKEKSKDYFVDFYLNEVELLINNFLV